MKPNSLIAHRAFTASPEANARARQQALNTMPPLMAMQDGVISYHSRGHLVILGPEDLIRLVADQIQGVTSITLVAMGNVFSQDDDHLEKAMQAASNLTPIYLPFASLKGWLGAFELRLTAPNGDQINPAEVSAGQDHFDLVLDLNPEPIIAAELSPPGYFHVGQYSDESSAQGLGIASDRLVDAIEQLSGMVGEFEKPAYVHVNHDICAHSDRGNIGCTRCLDVCPADALSTDNKTLSHDPQILVNVNLCHGAGSCTTACPTGALTFMAPGPQRWLDLLRLCLDSYQQFGGEHPAVLLHAEHSEFDLESLPRHILPVSLEEVGALGVEIWLSLLVHGTSYVALLLDDQTPPTLQALLKKEVSVTGRLLESMGHPASRISLVDASNLASNLTELDDCLKDWFGLPAGPAFTYKGKRKTLNEALDLLYEQGDSSDEPISLPNGSPYGQVLVNAQDCTLCMSCVSICPTQALRSASDHAPILAFTEADCVQCGLCEHSCPENAISLEARFAPASGMRSEPRVMKQEEPFHCISCGKAFATQSTIEKISKKLEAHPYFQGEAAKRLKMCDDCRVKDSYRELAADPTAQLRL